MLRRQWIIFLFSTAFVVSMAHSILPHSHPKEEGKHHNEASASSHHHGDHKHSHEKKSTPALPVFTHFSNVDYIGSTKYSYQEKHHPIFSVEQPLIISLALPIITYLPSPVPQARDLPQWLLLSIRSLRAPPFLIS
ncbi:MAG: hypothetical protein ABIS36_17465 [Chryseolinea sp.]